MAKKKIKSTETVEEVALKNVWWLSGDRYYTLKAKGEIISKINNDGSWNVSDISNITTAKEFSQALFPKDLLSIADKTILVFDGKVIPDGEDCYQMMLGIGDDRAVIIITPSIDKRTSLSKLFGSCLQEFDSVVDGRGFVKFDGLDEKIATFGKDVQWAGNCDLLKFIVENSEYNFLGASKEIEKLRIYTLKKDSDITNEDYMEIKSTKQGKSTDLLDLIKNKNAEETLLLLHDFFEEIEDRSEWIPILYLLLETFNMFLFCKIVDPKNYLGEFVVGSKVAEFWTKMEIKFENNERKVEAANVSGGAIGFRYKLDRKYIASRSLESLTEAVAAINKGIMDLIYNSELKQENIVKQVIAKLF